MRIGEFALERFFAAHEFSARHVLAASDIEGMGMAELLALADEETRLLWDGLKLGYTESAGLPLLRAEIASMYPGLSADDILVFAGAEEGIFLTMHATLEAGDHAIVVTPAYQSLYEVAQSIGARVSLVPLDNKDWSLDIDRISASIQANTRILVINFPHSPTGAHIDRSQLDALVRLCQERGVRLFSDEVYRLLEHNPGDLLPPAATLDDRALSLGVMSKAFGLAGVRIGWIATRDTVLRSRVTILKDYTTLCNSAPSEILALIGLRARDAVVGRARQIVNANLPVLAKFMRRHSEKLRWIPPRAGSVCFPRFVDDVDAGKVAEILIARTGVVILPGALFQYDRSHFRVGYGRTDMATALELIDPLIESKAILG